jgi:hypothetical protein
MVMTQPMDTNYDGYAETLVNDGDGDGYAESLLVDTNNDGYAETQEVDTNLDGQADVIVADTNLDGYVDTALNAGGLGLIGSVPVPSSAGTGSDTFTPSTPEDTGGADTSGYVSIAEFEAENGYVPQAVFDYEMQHDEAMANAVDVMFDRDLDHTLDGHDAAPDDPDRY